MGKYSKVQIQKTEKLNPDMKTLKTMTQDEKLAQKHQQNKDWKSAGTLKTHVPKQ
jgi:hypothetical protein